jgi:DNA-binding transcriptional ArsR family regulator
MDTDLADSGIDRVFRALSAEPRRRLLLLLAQEDASVSELAGEFEISRPAVSKHLSVLRRAGLVESESVGRRNVYRLNHEPLGEALGWFVELDAFWVEHLDDVDDRLDAINDPDRTDDAHD